LLLLLLQIWDLRKRKCTYTIPAHTSLVSTVRWQPGSGHVLLTAGYDCQAKLWSSRDWKLLKTLAGHEGKIMAADMCPVYSGSGLSSNGDGGRGLGACGLGGGYEALVCSVSYDRTIKVWAPEDVPDVVGDEESSGDDGDDDMMDE
jgi:U4/U6 small nuclear ribonucleoprotein PRP4